MLTKYWILLLLTITLQSWSQPVIENNYYTVQPAPGFQQDPAFIIVHKENKISRRILPQVQLVYTPEDPELRPAIMDGQPGVVAWKTARGLIQDINELGSIQLTARSYHIKNNQLVFSFDELPQARVSLIVKFENEQQAPIFEMGIQARRPGNFSLGFTGMPQLDSSEVDFVYQPLSWSWKRFPSRFALTEEAFANTAAVFTNHHGYTEGLAVSPSDIPYRYAIAAQWNNAGKKDNPFWSVFPADSPKPNSLFGMAIRNHTGKAQPIIYAFLPGTGQAKMKKGEQRKLSLVYWLEPGDWQKGTRYLLSTVFHYRSERQNARVSLNTTLENMLAFAMDDEYGGWNKELKGADYQFDVPGTVKNVSALHALSLAVITGNDDIMLKRALPTIEYVMSREKFLYTTSDTPHQTQAPSHLLNGPCVDIGELAALHNFTRGYTPAFAAEAGRLFGKTRQLNINTETGGGSWQDYLARYRINRNPADLQKAIEGADDYLNQVYHRYSRSFHDSPGLKDKAASFTTDYGYRIYDLYELYLETKNKLYLDAALTGARQLLLWTRSHPAPPAGNITVNKNGEVKGIFPGRRTSAVEGSVMTPMDVTEKVPEARIPAWQTSLNGLLPEAPSTYAYGPVMLAHHAAWLLRLAHHSGDTLLRDAAYNAVIGRYANFPGYYFTSLHTDVYQHANYPLRPYPEIKYNAIFYNHVWPHIALLMDFIVSDFYYRSKGKIHFPDVYAPGYAFLTSKVYGADKGTMMGHDSVQLWMPLKAVESDGIAMNYLMGYKDRDIFIAFANTSRQPATENITLNRDIIPWEAGKEYTVVIYNNNGNSTNGFVKNGRFTVTLPPGELNCIQIKGIYPQTKQPAPPFPASTRNRLIRINAPEDTTATVTAMIIQPNEKLAKFYLYANKTEKDWKHCTLRYRLKDSENWITVKDTAYPFEFDFLLGRPDEVVHFEVIATRHNGNTVPFPVQIINNDQPSFTVLGLGDSITEGGPDHFSYLFPLDSLLKKTGMRPHFIGPRRSIQSADTIYHSGFSGKTAEYLAEHIDSIYSAFPADIVLLHAGHNHFQEEKPITGIVNAQRRIIQSIKQKNPRAIVFVAAVISSGKLPKYAYIPALNKEIKSMVEGLKDSTVIFVDHEGFWDWKKHTTEDKVHANPSGARQIAANWFNSMAPVLSKNTKTDSLLPARELSVRNALPNFFSKVKANKTLRVAFLGGSITRAGGGYRDQLMNWLRSEFPACRFEEIMAAIGGTGSDFGASRVKEHVINHRPDLVFIEFAVNDNRVLMQKIRQTMEGIVRQIRKANAKTDICFIYTLAKENLPALQEGLFPASASAMEAVAAHYQIPSIHLGLAVVEEINKGNLLMMPVRDSSSSLPVFSRDGVHPLPETGHKIYTEVLKRNLLKIKNEGRAGKYKIPSALEPDNWENAGMISSWKDARFEGKWQLTDSVTRGKEFEQLLPRVYSTASPGASLTVRFKGTRFGLADIMGPGTGAIEITIDNQPPRVINRFDAFCTYYRMSYFIISGLQPGEHIVTIRLAPGKLDKAAILKTRNNVVKDWGPYQQQAMYIGAILY